jgi:hypothetical protein
MGDVESFDLSRDGDNPYRSSGGRPWPLYKVDLNGEPVQEQDVGRPNPLPPAPQGPRGRFSDAKLVAVIVVAVVGCTVFLIAVLLSQELTKVKEFAVAGISLGMGAASWIFGLCLGHRA